MSEIGLLCGIALLACGAYLLGLLHGVQLARGRQAAASAIPTPPAEVEIDSIFVPVQERRP